MAEILEITEVDEVAINAEIAISREVYAVKHQNSNNRSNISNPWVGGWGVGAFSFFCPHFGSPCTYLKICLGVLSLPA